MPEKNKPVETLRMGALKASIWKNESEGQAFYNVTFSRSYKKGEEWHESDSYGRDDLLPLAKLADMAHTRIFRLSAEAKKSTEGAR